MKDLSSYNWPEINQQLHDKGFTIVKDVLSEKECDSFKADYNTGVLYRKTINMERYRFGSGEYKYYQYPLPDLITRLRESVYPFIAPVANQWMQDLGLSIRYPPTHAEMRRISAEHGQTKPTVLILQYGPGGFNTL